MKLDYRLLSYTGKHVPLFVSNYPAEPSYGWTVKSTDDVNDAAPILTLNFAVFFPM